MSRDEETKIAILSSRLSAVEHILMKKFPEEADEFFKEFRKEMSKFIALIEGRYGE
jgi:hypothetical protein